jgi:N-acetylglucosamine-6-phosphate deacetylase
MNTLCYNSGMSTTIIHANVFTPDEILPDHSIEIENGVIKKVYPTGNSDAASKNDIINAQGLLVTPGLIDIHIHGDMGSDSMDATLEAYNTMSGFLCEHGVTSFLATTVTSSEVNISSALKMIERMMNKVTGAQLLGAHVEGPYINITYKGAQNPAYFRTPQKAEYEAWVETGVVKLITIAPELDGMDEFIRFCVDHNIELAIGHSQATYEQVRHAADLGARQATHLFNGMLGLHHREPGTVGGVLMDDRIYAQIIVDGVHLHPAIVKFVTQVKGIDHTILISDAMRATGLDNGKYDLGGQEVTVMGGVARIANGSPGRQHPHPG